MDNVLADTLSRSPVTEAETESDQLAKLTSSAVSNWRERILIENRSNPRIIQKGEKVVGNEADPDYSIKREFCISEIGFVSDHRLI